MSRHIAAAASSTRKMDELLRRQFEQPDVIAGLCFDLNSSVSSRKQQSDSLSNLFLRFTWQGI